MKERFKGRLRGRNSGLPLRRDPRHGSPDADLQEEESMVRSFHRHRRMMARNPMHVDNIGGAIARVAGKRVEVQAFPWRFQGGEACVTRLPACMDG